MTARLGVARYSHPVQVRARWVALVVCAVLSACAPPDVGPTPNGTLEPSITESSPEPPKRAPNEACALLTAAEREDLMGMAMNAEVPVKPLNGTQECIWTRSLNEPARSAIRVVALNGTTWSQVARPQIVRAIAQPSTSRALAKKLRAAMADLSSSPTLLTDERICEIYLLVTEAYGLHRSEDMVYYGALGAMPAVYAASCEEGRIVLAGFGEYGLRGSIAANHAAFRLVDAADDRAADLLGTEDAPDSDAEDEDEEADAGDEPPSPDSSPGEADETGAGEEEDS